ncbi:unnamed protein product, partial [Acidithrix sp. C25]
VLTEEGLKRITMAEPIHAVAVCHCFANVLSGQQLIALSEISQTILAHLEVEQLTNVYRGDWLLIGR